jgi:hypothetical protein
LCLAHARHGHGGLASVAPVAYAHKMGATTIETSAVLIVRNEARCLAECLAALEGVVDEIVVTDTGSTDHTMDIAAQFTRPVLHRSLAR